MESLLALFTLALVFVVLEASWTLIARSLTLARRESVAATLARTRRESSLAGPCTLASGVDSLDGVSVTWESLTDSGYAQIHQTSRFHGLYGERVVKYDSKMACLP